MSKELKNDYKDYDTFAVANYILDKLESYTIEVTNLKLQKLMYFAYGINLSLFNEKLFCSQIEAWPLGPVIPSVYTEFKGYIKEPIKTRAYSEKNDKSGEVVLPILDKGNKYIQSLNIACAAYGNKKASTLVNMTHNEKGAWFKCYKDNERDIIIPDDKIKKEFDDYLKDLSHYLLSK